MSQRTSMRIVGWNIRAGGGRRVSRIARALAHWHPDLVALSEFRGTPPSEELARLLRHQGLPFQCTTADAEVPARNALLVASRWPLCRLRGTSDVPQEPARWLPVRVEAPQPLILGALHVPNRATGRKLTFLDGARLQAERWRAEQAVIIGDTNSGKPDIDEQSPAFNQHEGGWIDALHDIGWRDAYRLHAGRRRAYTWYSPNRDNGFRLDQAFLSPAVADRLRRATHCWAGGSRRSGVSDHAAVLVDIRTK